jgi:hypothetical protein
VERDTVTVERDLARAKDRPTGPTGQDRPTGRAQAREAAASFPQEAGLQALAAIPGYPFNHEQDTARLEEFAAEAPNVDLVLELHKIRDWIADKRKPPKNWRLFVRNWVVKAQKEAEEQRRLSEPARSTPPELPRLPPVTEDDWRCQGEEAHRAREAIVGLVGARGMP